MLPRRGVSAFRRWFAKYGGGEVPYRGGQRPIPVFTKAQLLDRFTWFSAGREDTRQVCVCAPGGTLASADS